MAAAAKLLATETLRMLEADASNDPPKGAPDGVKKRKSLRPMEPALLDEAERLLREEMAPLDAALAASPQELRSIWERLTDEFIYVPSLQAYAEQSSVGVKEQVGASEQELQLLKTLMQRDAKKATKAEKKLETLLGGYRKRAAALEKKCQGQQAAVREKQVELGCFEALRRSEGLARPQRLSAMEAFAREQLEREAQLQARYAELQRKRLTLREQLS
jgi:pre-mRNA-splicing factor CDC5/CEF1